MILSSHVESVLPNFPIAKRHQIENAMLDITLRMCDARGFSSFVKPIGVKPSEIRLLKQDLFSRFTLGPCLKFAMVWIARRPAVLKNEALMIEGFERFELDASHVEAFERLREQKLFSAFVKKCREAPLEIDNADHAVLSCNRALSTCKEFTRRFAIAKMRFITKAQNEPTVEPIIQDLLEIGASMFYEIAPWLTWDHTINYLKRTIHSRGINRIKFETTDSRKRLIGAPGSHENRIISLDALTSGARLDDARLTGALAEIEAEGMRAIESPMVYQEIKATFSKLVDRYEKKPKKQMAVKLLAMHDVPGFAELVRRETGNLMITSTEDVLEELGVTVFHAMVQKFVGANADAFNMFLKSLQREFEGV